MSRELTILWSGGNLEPYFTLRLLASEPVGIVKYKPQDSESSSTSHFTFKVTLKSSSGRQRTTNLACHFPQIDCLFDN